jgi:hypothetical protein
MQMSPEGQSAAVLQSWTPGVPHEDVHVEAPPAKQQTSPPGQFARLKQEMAIPVQLAAHVSVAGQHSGVEPLQVLVPQVT